MKKNFIGVFVSLALIALLVVMMRDKLPSILQTLKNGNHALIFAALLIFLSTVWVMALRLKLIFNTKAIPMAVREAASLTFVGYFFNNVLPTSVGGDLVKAMCASRLSGEPVKSLTVIMMDRIFGLFMFILIPCASLIFLRDKIDPRVPVIVYSFLFFSTMCFFLLFNRSIARRFHFIERTLNRVGLGAKVRMIYDELHDFKNHKKIVVIAMLLSVLGQVLAIVVLYLLAVALGADPGTWAYFFLLVPVVHLISMVPITMGGLGLREGGYVVFLKNFIGSEKALGMGILSFGFLLFLSVIGGFIYLFRREYHIQLSKPDATKTSE